MKKCINVKKIIIRICLISLLVGILLSAFSLKADAFTNVMISDKEIIPALVPALESMEQNNELMTVDLASVVGSNIIVNGDFESAPSGSWPTFMDSTKGVASFYWDSTVYHGSYGHSIKIMGNGVTAGTLKSVTIQPGKVYAFSAWGKALNVSTSNQEIGSIIAISQIDKNNNIISSRYFSNSGTFDWEQAKCNFVADPNVNSVFISLMLEGSGTVWFDDVSLTETGTIPVAALPPVIADPGPDRSTYKGFRVNLDGSKSNGTSLIYEWQMVSIPAGSQSVLVNQNSVNPNFIPDVAGDYTVSLTVTDSSGHIDQKQITIRAKEISDTSDDLSYNSLNSSSKNYLTGYVFQDMVPLADGWIIIGDTSKNKVIIINTITGEVGKEYQLNSSPTQIDFDFDKGIIIATQSATNNIAAINVVADEINYIATSGQNKALTFGEGNIVFSYCKDQSYNGKINIIDLEKQQVINTTAISEGYIGYMAYDKNYNNLLLGVAGISPSSLYRYTFNELNQQLTYAEYLWNPGSNGKDLAISNDGKHLAFCCGGGNGNGYTIYDFDPSNLQNTYGEWNTGAYPVAAAFSVDNQYLVATDSMENIKLFDVNTHVLKKTISLGWGAFISKVGISRGNKILYGLKGDHNLYYFLTEGTSTVSPPTITGVTTDINSPQEVGTKIQITADASGGSELYYSFSIYNGNGWEIIQPYLTSNTFDWTPVTPGYYSIVVELKNKNSSKDYDAYTLIGYSVSPYIGLNVTSSGTNQVSLTWSAVSGASSYNVYRAVGADSNYIKIGSAMVPSYPDSNLTSGTTYYYRVGAVKATSEELSSPVSITTLPDKPGVPLGLTAIAAGSTQIDLSWTEVDGTTSYNVYRADGTDGSYSKIGSATILSYTDNNLTAGTTYYYKISAANEAGEGQQSSVASATTFGFIAKPAVEVGINPNDGSAGLFIGIKDVKDTGGSPIADQIVKSYSLEFEYNPDIIQVLSVNDFAGLGNITTSYTYDQGSNKLVVTNTSTAGTIDIDRLVFLTITTIQSVKELSPLTVKVSNVNGDNHAQILVVDTPIINFHRGKIINQDSDSAPDIADAVAGLQYLAGLKKAGIDSGKINVVNMASVITATNAEKNVPSVKDVIGLLQYLAGSRDEFLNIKN